MAARKCSQSKGQLMSGIHRQSFPATDSAGGRTFVKLQDIKRLKSNPLVISTRASPIGLVLADPRPLIGDALRSA